MPMTPSSFARFSRVGPGDSSKPHRDHCAPQEAKIANQFIETRNGKPRSRRRLSHGLEYSSVELLHGLQDQADLLQYDPGALIAPSSPQVTLDLTQKTKQTGLRQQHIATLTAVLHTCLFEGDYARASRAWGMLLRTQAHGRFLDFRRHDRWGFGAEILAFRSTGEQEQDPVMNSQLQVNKFSQRSSKRDPNFTSYVQGLENAKDYYRRLIIQYPYRRTAANALSPLNFYPALFGLCISMINEQHVAGLKDLVSHHFLADEAQIASHLSSVTNIMLSGAMRIVDELDELLLSPPYSDNARLWNLRGMMTWWLDDLRQVACRAVEGSSPSEELDDTTNPGDLAAKSSVPAQDSTKAQQCFARARSLDGNNSFVPGVIHGYMGA